MSSTLESLFEQILHTEQKALEQKSILNEVKTEISKCQTDIKDAQAEAETLQGQLVIKVHQWSTAEQQLKTLASRQQILQQQREELLHQKQEVAHKLADLNRKLDLEHQRFCQKVQEFAHNYDLISVGQHQRELSAREEIKSLQLYITQLETELHEYKKKQLNIHELQNALEQLQKQVHQKGSELQDTEGVLACEQQITMDQQQEKSRVEQIPHSGQEFKKLQEELDACCDDTLEGVCVALQGELQELQQQQWQKKLKQKCVQQQQRMNKQKQFYPDRQTADHRKMQHPKKQCLQNEQQKQAETRQEHKQISQTQQQQSNQKQTEWQQQGKPAFDYSHHESRGALPRGNFQRFTNYSAASATSLSGAGDAPLNDSGKNTTSKRPNLTRLSSAMKSKSAETKSQGHWPVKFRGNRGTASKSTHSAQ